MIQLTQKQIAYIQIGLREKIKEYEKAIKEATLEEAKQNFNIERKCYKEILDLVSKEMYFYILNRQIIKEPEVEDD